MARKKKEPVLPAAPMAEQEPAGDEAAQTWEAGFVPRVKPVKGSGSVRKKFEERKGRRPLAPEELPELHRKIREGYALKMGLVEELKLKAEEVKEVKGRLNQRVKELEDDLSFVATGSRPEQRRCLVTKDFTAGRSVSVDVETGEVYEDRELRAWERQGELFQDDCLNCKYCDCKSQSLWTACPENFEDCYHCPQFTCAFLPLRCNNKTQYRAAGEIGVEPGEAEFADCFFCYYQDCADNDSCGRRIDCHSCEKFKCTVSKRFIKDGYCVTASKAVAVPEGDDGGGCDCGECGGEPGENDDFDDINDFSTSGEGAQV